MEGTVPAMENNDPIYIDSQGTRVIDLKPIEAPAAAAAPTPSAKVTVQPSEQTTVVKPAEQQVSQQPVEAPAGGISVSEVYSATSPYNITLLPTTPKTFRIQKDGSDLGVFKLGPDSNTFIPAQ